MRVLKDLVSLTTITVYVVEIKGYVPPQAPTLGVRISRTFAGSWKALVATGEGLAIAAVAVAPWLGVIGVPVFVIVSLVRRSRRR